MPDALHETDAPPPVPGFWRLGWLLFMQPLTLHRLFAAWGLRKDPSLWALKGRLRSGDLVARTLVARLSGWLLLVMPVSTVAIAGCVNLMGLPVDWGKLAFNVAVGFATGVAVGVTFNLAIGVAFGVAGGVAVSVVAAVASKVFGGVAIGVASGVAGGVSGGVAIGVAIGVFFGVAIGVGAGVFFGIFFGIFFGAVFYLAAGAAFGVAIGVAFDVAFLLALFRLPTYPLEASLTVALRLLARLWPASLPRLTHYLPYRHHELIYFPLPFLAGFLVELGEEHPAKGRRALAEAAASTGQKGPSRRALVELQARSLERAAREKQYAAAADLALPFLSQGEPTLDSIATAAQDLEAARSTTSHHQRRQALLRARNELERTLDRLTGSLSLTRADQRFLPVVKSWIDRVADEEAALVLLERERPQVPLVFVAGPPLTLADESLFKKRTDLVRLLDQDLAAERPVPLVLLGQRRMGKSTLLNFLPRLLGTGTRVVQLNFQALSGHSLKGEPHRWVAEEVATALAGEGIEATPPPPEEAPWSATLDWLARLEEPLATAGRRLLIALDEVEGLERGIQDGWGDPAFLDFLRAAGDRLHRSRFLLVTAHPFSRLGPHWSDRLISVQTRRIEPLGEQEARELLTQPVPGFPEIYPEGAVEHLLTETACHPYLLQLIAYQLTRRLNDAGRLKALDDDISAAVDLALGENTLFQNLWDDLTAPQRRMLAALARGEKPPEAAGDESETLRQARRDLAREQLIRQDGEGTGGWRVTVPLFARWIREIGTAA